MDLREEFVRDFVFPMLRANAVYEGSLPAGHLDRAARSSPRPRWRSRAQEGADAVSHGATGKGNDQVRFELTYAALAPELTVIAPWREWDLNSRTALIEFARRHDIPVPVTAERPYSTDRNLFHISFEGGILEDPWTEPPPKMFLLTQLAGVGARRAGLRRDRVRGGQSGRGGRAAALARRAARGGSTGSAASTASAGSTWSRTASSA